MKWTLTSLRVESMSRVYETFTSLSKLSSLITLDTFDINSRENSSQEGGNDKGLFKEEEFGLGGLNMDRPIT